MSYHNPFLVRLHGWLLVLLRPALGKDYVIQANATFHDIYIEARKASLKSRAQLWIREIRSLVHTLLSEIARRYFFSGRRRNLPRGTTATPKRPGTKRGNGPSSRPGVREIFDALIRDLRYTVRGFVKAPVFVAVSVLSLAIGIATATGMFGILNAVLLRDAPYVGDQKALVRIFGTFPPDEFYGPLSYLDVMDIGEWGGTLADIAAYRSATLTLSSVGEGSRQVDAEQVSPNWFQMLQVPMRLGRGFLPEDETSGVLVAVIGFRMWQRDFEGDPSVLGESIRVDGRIHEIVGVAPEGMLAHEDPMVLDIWTLVPEHTRRERGHIGLKAVARITSTATMAQVQGELNLIAGRLVEEYPDKWVDHNDQPRGLSVLSDRAGRLPPGQAGDIYTLFGLLAVVVALLLLIACSNVANLLLTRAWRRRSEIAIRLALGATRRHLIAQLLTESVMLALLAGGLGLMVIHAISSVLAAGGWLIELPAAVDVGVDWLVAGFALGLATTTGVVFGLAPALQASKPSLVPALKGIECGGKRSRITMRNFLVVAQVAASLVLVFGSGLLLRSLNEARNIDVGFDPENVGVVSLDLSHGEYGEEEAQQFYAGLLERLRAIPGIEGAALASRVPLEGGRTRFGGVEPEGYELGPHEYLSIEANTVSSGYFDLVRMPILRGRDFVATDRVGEPKVLIVNESFVNRFWPGQDAIGKRVSIHDDFEVVGVVRNALYATLTENSPPHIWLPSTQRPGTMDYRVHVRTAGDPSAILTTIREEIHGLDADLPIVGSTLMKSLSGRALLPYNILSAVLSSAGLVALALAMMGIYGVMAYAVSQRVREVGIRVAIGAKQGSVVGMIVREGVALAAVGVVAAVPIIVLLSQLLKTFVVGISPLDSLSLLGGVFLLALAVTAATLVPALRASKIDPMMALRSE